MLLTRQVSDNPSDTGSPVEHLRAHVFERPVDAKQFDALPPDWCSKSGRWSPSKAAVRERAACVGRILPVADRAASRDAGCAIGPNARSR